MKLQTFSSGGSTPSPQGFSMSPTAGTSVRWSNWNSAFCPVRSAVAAMDMSIAEVPYPAMISSSHMMMRPYRVINDQNLPLVWPFGPSYPPMQTPNPLYFSNTRTEYQRQVRLQLDYINLRQHERFRQQLSPDRASLDAAGQTPEMARIGKCLLQEILSYYIQPPVWLNIHNILWCNIIIYNIMIMSPQSPSYGSNVVCIKKMSVHLYFSKTVYIFLIFSIKSITDRYSWKCYLS